MIRYRDLYFHFVRGRVIPPNSDEKLEWDNFAETRHWETPQKIVELDKTKGSALEHAWSSKEACKNACQQWKDCLSWKYRDGDCYAAKHLRMGRPSSSVVRMDSGWMPDRIRKLENKTCGPKYGFKG